MRSENRISGSYTEFDGEATYDVAVVRNATTKFRIASTTYDGELTVALYDGVRCLFLGTDPKGDSVIVNGQDTDTVEVRITGAKHAGDFLILWDRENVPVKE